MVEWVLMLWLFAPTGEIVNTTEAQTRFATEAECVFYVITMGSQLEEHNAQIVQMGEPGELLIQAPDGGQVATQCQKREYI